MAELDPCEHGWGLHSEYLNSRTNLTLSYNVCSLCEDYDFIYAKDGEDLERFHGYEEFRDARKKK